MEVGGPIALPLGKEAEAGWAPKPVWTQR